MMTAVLKSPSYVTHVLLDGFPRSADNMDAWNKVIGDSLAVEFLLYFKLTTDEMMKRIMARAAASKVKRSDDNEETIKKRLGVFENTSLPVLKSFGDKVCEIDDSGSKTQV